MRAKILRLVRGGAMGLSLLMFVISGHVWNTDRVIAPMIYAFDFMIALITIFVIAVLMQDAGEKRKNVTVITLIMMSGAMTVLTLVAVS